MTKKNVNQPTPNEEVNMNTFLIILSIAASIGLSYSLDTIYFMFALMLILGVGSITLMVQNKAKPIQLLGGTMMCLSLILGAVLGIFS